MKAQGRVVVISERPKPEVNQRTRAKRASIIQMKLPERRTKKYAAPSRRIVLSSAVEGSAAIS